MKEDKFETMKISTKKGNIDLTNYFTCSMFITLKYFSRTQRLNLWSWYIVS